MNDGKYYLDDMKSEQNVFEEYPWMLCEYEKPKKKKSKKKDKKKKKHKSKKYKTSKKEMKMRLIEKAANVAIDTTADIFRMHFKKKYDC